MIIRFLNDFLRAYTSPTSLYQDIAREKQNRSWLCVLLYSLLYVAGSFWLYFKGYTPFEAPWITLPKDIYYLVQAFYILPLVFLMWILAAGVLRILSNPFGGRGTFDTLFLMTGYSLWAPWYPLFIVDCIHATPEWLYNAVLGFCILLVLIGTTIAVKVEEKTRLMAAIASTVIAVTSIGLILFTYIR